MYRLQQQLKGLHCISLRVGDQHLGSLTIFLKSTLVAGAADNSLPISLGSLNFLLNGHKPPVLLPSGNSLEGVCLPVKLQAEVIKAALCEVGCVRLSIVRDLLD